MEVVESKSFSDTGVASAIARVIVVEENDGVTVKRVGALLWSRVNEKRPAPRVKGNPLIFGTSMIGEPKRTSLFRIGTAL